MVSHITRPSKEQQRRERQCVLTLLVRFVFLFVLPNCLTLSSGVSVGVYGVITGNEDGDQGFYNCSFTLDDAKPVYKTPDTRTGGLRLHEELFQADISAGDHSLLIELVTVNLTSPGNASILYLDYILYGPTTSTKFKLPAAIATPSVVIPNIPGKPNPQGTLTGPIIGATIGGLAFLIALWMIFRRVRAKRKARFIRPARQGTSAVAGRHRSGSEGERASLLGCDISLITYF